MRKIFYEFGAFRLSPDERLLLRRRRDQNDEPVHLQAKAFDTLLVLVENSGHLLTKEELLEKVWAESFVEENNLTKNISALRKALNDSGAEEFIETVPRRGYRFKADVHKVSTADAAAADDESFLLENQTKYRLVVKEEITETAEARKISSPKFKYFIFAVCAAAVLLVAGFLRLNFSDAKKNEITTAASAQTKTLAVIPFRNLKSEPENDFLSYALAESITGKLGYVKNLVVRPTAAGEKFRDQPDAQIIGSQLNSQAILTGSFVKEGDGLQINVELIDAEKNQVLWQDAFSVQYEKLSTVRERVATDVVRGLRLNLSTDETARMKSGYIPDPSAYEYDLRGLSYGRRSDYQTALKMYEKAIEIDPSFALAWTHIAAVCYFYASDKSSGREYRERAERALNRALELEPNQIEARLEKAFQMIDAEGRGEEAIPILRDIIETKDNNAFAHWHLSQAYRYGGALDQSIAEAERALQIDPEVMSDTTLNTYFYAGNYEKFLDSLARKQDGARTCFYRGLIFVYLQDDNRAAREFDRAYELDSTYPHAAIGQAIKAALMKQNVDGKRILKQLERYKNFTDGEMTYKIAQAYALLGNKPDALRLLHKSVEQNFFCYPYFTNDSLLNNLCDEPEFIKILNVARQRHEEFKRKFF